MKPVYALREDAKKANWFSRRHQTTAEHNATRAAWAEKQARKRDYAKVRQEIYAKHSAKEKLILLDQRLGVGQGAARERKRLAS